MDMSLREHYFISIGEQIAWVQSEKSTFPGARGKKDRRKLEDREKT